MVEQIILGTPRKRNSNGSMKCRHCNALYEEVRTPIYLHKDDHGYWNLDRTTCPGCKKFNFTFTAYSQFNSVFGIGETLAEFQWPVAALRPPCPPEVEESYARNYRQACATLQASPEASAALSRRCMESLLAHKAGFDPDGKLTLTVLIDKAVKSNTLPPYIADNLNAVKEIGNYGAHPRKSQHTGEIMDVEPQEAEWNLEVLEALFDFYFVQEAKNQARRAALNQKQAEAGKRPV